MNQECSADLLAEISAKLDRIALALEALVSDAARCPHGGIGLCMACVMQNDLLRPPR